MTGNNTYLEQLNDDKFICYKTNIKESGNVHYIYKNCDYDEKRNCYKYTIIKYYSTVITRFNIVNDEKMLNVIKILGLIIPAITSQIAQV
jgi:hypothetical protein